MGCCASREHKAYTDSAAWFVREQTGAKPADCFYAHPTTEIGLCSWNAGQMGYAKGDKLTGSAAGTKDLLDTQAKALSETCNMWVPRYNQLGMLSLGKAEPGMSDAKAQEFVEHCTEAIDDLKKAFQEFLDERTDKTRPFFIFGHSQGSILMTRVIKDCLAGSEHQKHFVAAYLAGGYIPIDLVPLLGGDIHVCTGPEDTNCIISWDTRLIDIWEPSKINEGFLGLWPHSIYWLIFDKYCEEPTAKDPESKPRVEVSPLTWSTAAGPGQGYLGARLYQQEEPEMAPATFGEGVKPGPHEVWVPDPKQWMTDPGPAAGIGNLHPADVTLWFYNIKDNVAKRLNAFKKDNSVQGEMTTKEVEDNNTTRI